MNRKRHRLLSCILLGAVTTSLVFTGGCGKEEEKTYVAVIVKSQSPYWQTTKLGVEDAANEMKIKVTYEAPEKEDVKKQIEYLKNAIANKADAIVIAPSEDNDEMAKVLKEAQSNNIPVIAIDTELNEDERNSCISTNNTYAGAIAARKAAELLGDGGEIGVIIHAPTSPLAIERKSGFADQLEVYNAEMITDDGDSTQPAYNIVATENGENDIEKTRIATQKLLMDNPKIEFIFATSQTTTRGVCLAIDELELGDKVDIIGFDSFDAKDGCKSSNEYIESGVLDGFILQNPYNMGYLGVRYARDLINGQTIATNIDTGATLVTSDNIKDSDIHLIMNPTDY